MDKYLEARRDIDRSHDHMVALALGIIGGGIIGMLSTGFFELEDWSKMGIGGFSSAISGAIISCFLTKVTRDQITSLRYEIIRKDEEISDLRKQLLNPKGF